jgi:hypothetical protein
MAELNYQTVLTSTEIALSNYSFVRPLTIGLLACRVRAGQLALTDLGGPAASFLSRIGFYSYIGANDPYFVRGETSKTIEIQSCADVEKAIGRACALIADFKSRRTVELIMTEIIGNVEMHARAEGLLVGQVIRNRMELAIVDAGVGIHESLKQNPEYADVTEDRALRLSLVKGVTAGGGRGFGLWSAYEVLKANRGSLSLGSGNYRYELKSDSVNRTAHWQGTYFALIYDIGNPVDYSVVTGLAKDFRIEEDENDFPF